MALEEGLTALADAAPDLGDESLLLEEIQHRAHRRRRARTATAGAMVGTAVVLVVVALVSMRPSSSMLLEAADPTDHGAAMTEPPDPAGPTVTTFPVPPTPGPAGAVVVQGAIGQMSWQIVEHGGGVASPCWRLVLPSETPVHCGFAVPQLRLLGVEVENAEEHAVLWGPVADTVASVQIRLGDGTSFEAPIHRADPAADERPTSFFVVETPLGVLIEDVSVVSPDGEVLDALPMNFAPCPCPDEQTTGGVPAGEDAEADSAFD